jgi:hypothetical protein
MLVDSLSLLGNMPPDSGLSSTIASIYLARVKDKVKPQQEEGEAIEEIFSMTSEEIKRAFLLGYCEREIKGVKTRIPFRDPFLAYALLLYEIRCAR